MTSATRTLRDFFALADDDQAAQRVAALESSAVLSTLAATISAAAGPASWQHALMDVARAIPDLLKVDLGSVLAGAWKKGSELGRFTDAHQYAPDETILVELTTHVVTSQHRPHLDVLLNDQPRGRLDFTVEIALRVEGAMLTIKDGKIWKATTGACTGERSHLVRRTNAQRARVGARAAPRYAGLRPADSDRAETRRVGRDTAVVVQGAGGHFAPYGHEHLLCHKLPHAGVGIEPSRPGRSRLCLRRVLLSQPRQVRDDSQ